VYATTYWGTRDGIEYGGSYEGDVLLRIDPERRTTESLGPVLAGHGVPSLAGWAERSEEHTSELQSRENLVCRLLLEKKKDLTNDRAFLHIFVNDLRKALGP